MKLIGVHMHIGSAVNYQHLERVYNVMVKQVIALSQDISAISAWGACRSLTSMEKKRLILNTIFYYGTAHASERANCCTS